MRARGALLPSMALNRSRPARRAAPAWAIPFTPDPRYNATGQPHVRPFPRMVDLHLARAVEPLYLYSTAQPIRGPPSPKDGTFSPRGERERTTDSLAGEAGAKLQVPSGEPRGGVPGHVRRTCANPRRC